MTTFQDIEISTEFVLKGESYIWKKTANNRAKCMSAPDNTIDTETAFALEAKVVVIEDAKISRGNPNEPIVDGMKVIFLNSDEEPIGERIVPASVAMILSTSEFIIVRLPPNKKREVVTIGERGFDLEERELFLEIIDREPASKGMK